VIIGSIPQNVKRSYHFSVFAFFEKYVLHIPLPNFGSIETIENFQPIIKNTFTKKTKQNSQGIHLEASA
jgi:hypothetical protein